MPTWFISFLLVWLAGVVMLVFVAIATIGNNIRDDENKFEQRCSADNGAAIRTLRGEYYCIKRSAFVETVR